MVNLEGLFPPIPTPFTAEEEIDYDALKKNIAKWNAFDFAGLVVQGSNGEAVYMSEAERVELVRFVRSQLPRPKLLIAGAGMESTRQTIAMAKAMADAGADALLVLTPGYFKGKMTAAALEHHFVKVADASPIPVILYNMPACTGVDMDAATVIRLSAHPNIIGLKDSGGNVAKFGAIHNKTRVTGFQLLAGSAGFLLPALIMGAVGGVCALANVAPQPLLDMLAAYKAGDMAKAQDIQYTMVAPNNAVTAQFGVPGLKAALDMLGYYGGPARSPLLPLSEAETTTLKNILTAAGVLA